MTNPVTPPGPADDEGIWMVTEPSVALLRALDRVGGGELALLGQESTGAWPWWPESWDGQTESATHRSPDFPIPPDGGGAICAFVLLDLAGMPAWRVLVRLNGKYVVSPVRRHPATGRDCALIPLPDPSSVTTIAYTYSEEQLSADGLSPHPAGPTDPVRLLTIDVRTGPCRTESGPCQPEPGPAPQYTRQEPA